MLPQTIQIGDRVELEATNPAGVALHREARSSMFGRAPTGTIGTIQELQTESNWIRLLLEDGRAEWIVRRYVARVVPAEGQVVEESQDAWAVWTSREQCEQVVGVGRRMAEQQADTIRIANWNIRWFPDGDMNNTEPEKMTDLPCVIAWMNVDVLALEEIRTSVAADDAWESVLDGLFGITGQTWEVDLQSCGPPKNQHVGFLWNTGRIALSDSRDEWRFNGAAENPNNPCNGNLRPGRYAYFTSAQANGLDIHVFVVHLDSGKSTRDREHRKVAIERIDQAVAPLLPRDRDVVILGDLNTMGTDPGEGTPAGESGGQEIQAMRATVAQEAPGFTPVTAPGTVSPQRFDSGGTVEARSMVAARHGKRLKRLKIKS